MLGRLFHLAMLRLEYARTAHSRFARRGDPVVASDLLGPCVASARKPYKPDGNGISSPSAGPAIWGRPLRSKGLT